MVFRLSAACRLCQSIVCGIHIKWTLMINYVSIFTNHVKGIWSLSQFLLLVSLGFYLRLQCACLWAPRARGGPRPLIRHRRGRAKHQALTTMSFIAHSPAHNIYAEMTPCLGRFLTQNGGCSLEIRRRLYWSRQFIQTRWVCGKSKYKSFQCSHLTWHV